MKRLLHFSTLHPLLALAVVLGRIAVAADPHDPTHSDEAIDEIVVSVSPLGRRADELTVPVTSLDRDQIVHHLGSTLGETLALEPGIATSGFAAGASRPVIRGQDAQRVRILQDGLGVHDVSDLSPDHGVPVNPLVAQRVEVLRGPGTLRYGGGATGGVVSVLTNRVPRVLPEGPVTGELYAGYGTVARQRDSALLAEGAAGNLGWHFDAASRDSHDYKVPDQADRRQSGSETDGYLMSGGAAYFFERARIGAAFERYANRYGIPEPGEPVEIDLSKHAWLVEADLETPLPGIDKLSLRASTSDYEHSEFAGGALGATFKNNQDEVRLEFLHRPKSGVEGLFGLSYGARDFEGLGEAADFLLPTQTLSHSAFLFEELALADWLRLQLAGRVESVSVRGTPAAGPRRTERFTPLSASVGALIELPVGLSGGLSGGLSRSLNVGLNAVYQERAPAPLELYARGPHEATETFEIGNPDIDEERSFGFDMVLRGSTGPLRAELSAFYTDYADYVFAALTGRRCDELGACGVVGELKEIRYEQQGAVFYGAEFSGAIELLEFWGGHLGLDFQLDVVRARLDRGGNLPRLTPKRYGGGLHFSNQRIHTRIGALRTDKQRREGRTETETSGYTFINFEFAIEILEVDDRSLELSLSGVNLTDANARNHLSFRKDDQLSPGRGFRFGLRARF